MSETCPTCGSKVPGEDADESFATVVKAGLIVQAMDATTPGEPTEELWQQRVVREQGLCGAIHTPGMVCIREPGHAAPTPGEDAR